MPLYSHSRLSTFEQCPIKYKFKYIDNLLPDYEDSIETFLGKKIHESLEWLYKNAKQKSIVLDDLIKHYIDSWSKDYNKEIKVIKQELTSEYYFNKGIRFLISYFLKHSPFIDNTIATEKKVFINVDDKKKYRLVGYIDRLVHNPGNIFEIHDYKTSSSMKTQKELDKDKQLALYSIAIRDEFKEVNEVKLIWHFLDFNQTVISKRTLKQLEELKQEIINLIDNIELTASFYPNPGGLCKWCEYRSYCPFIKENPNYPEINL